MSTVDDAVAAVRDGRPIIVPTDTVYGLAADGLSSAAAAALYAAKGRAAHQPTALVVASVELVHVALPGLSADVVRAIEALLPGPLTLVVPNPDRRFAWLSAERPDTLGLRVPAFSGPGAEVLDAVSFLVATSANLPGGPDPKSLEEVPAELLDAVAAVVDGGTLPGVPSTVVDLTGPEPAILREGAIPAAEVRARLAGLTDR